MMTLKETTSDPHWVEEKLMSDRLHIHMKLTHYFTLKRHLNRKAWKREHHDLGFKSTSNKLRGFTNYYLFPLRIFPRTQEITAVCSELQLFSSLITKQNYSVYYLFFSFLWAFFLSSSLKSGVTGESFPHEDDFWVLMRPRRLNLTCCAGWISSPWAWK